MKEKNSILFKKLDLVFVYIVIFLVGMAIVFGMTTYLNSKVKEFTDLSTTTNTTK